MLRARKLVIVQPARQDEPFETLTLGGGGGSSEGTGTAPRAGTVLNGRYRLIEDVDPASWGGELVAT